jgi:hypothetical protein
VDVVRADVDAECCEVEGAAAFALAAVFGGVQDVGAYETGRVAVEEFGEAGRRGRGRADPQGWERAEAVAAPGAWGADAQHPGEESEGKVQHVGAPI